MFVAFILEHEEKIKWELDKKEKEISLSLNSTITTTSSLISLTMTVKTDVAASALIIIEMPDATLEFDEHLYTGKYEPATKTLTMAENITLKSSQPEDTNLTLTGGK